MIDICLFYPAKIVCVILLHHEWHLCVTSKQNMLQLCDSWETPVPKSKIQPTNVACIHMHSILLLITNHLIELLISIIVNPEPLDTLRGIYSMPLAVIFNDCISKTLSIRYTCHLIQTISLIELHSDIGRCRQIEKSIANIVWWVKIKPCYISTEIHIARPFTNID